MSPEQRRLLESLASLAAMVIEQAELVEQAHRVQLLEATEKLQAALLNSISHDLRTPLVEIAVCDQGIGIPPEDLAHVFDKICRVQQPGRVAGTGLGLSISKGFVEANGGRIWAQNRSGGGTVVTLALPLGRPDHSAEAGSYCQVGMCADPT